MNVSRVSKIAILLAAIGQPFAQQRAMAAGLEGAARPQQARAPLPVSDVRLTGQNRLLGMVVDQSGLGLRDIEIIVAQNSQLVGASRTNDQGEFSLPVSRGGVYQIQAAGSGGIYRVWSAQAAPPSAAPRVLIVAGKGTMRAQGGVAYDWISEHPWCFYSLLATAIVVPIVIVSANDDDDSSS